MRLSYKNDNGDKYTLHDSYSNHIRIIDIEGLEPPGKTIQTAKYPFQPGQVTTYSNYNARTITVGYDLITEDKQQEAEFRKLINIFNVPGYLHIETNNINRRIYCNHCVIKKGDRQNSKILRVVLQFTCDYPLFEESNTENKSLYAITPLLSAGSVFPCVLSTIEGGSGIYNNKGSANAEPIITINIINNPNSAVYDLRIFNETTNEVIELLGIKLLGGSVLTIDIPDRNIYTADGETLLNSISDDTFIDGFKFVPGENKIEISCSDAMVEYEISMVVRTVYTEAVI